MTDPRHGSRYEPHTFQPDRLDPDVCGAMLTNTRGHALRCLLPVRNDLHPTYTCDVCGAPLGTPSACPNSMPLPEHHEWTDDEIKRQLTYVNAHLAAGEQTNRLLVTVAIERDPPE